MKFDFIVNLILSTNQILWNEEFLHIRQRLSVFLTPRFQKNLIQCSKGIYDKVNLLILVLFSRELRFLPIYYHVDPK